MAYQDRTHFPAPVNGHCVKMPVLISASKTSGALASSVQNPERAAVIVERCFIHVKTGSSAACTIDVGVKTSDATSDSIIDGISVNAAANTIYDNITDKGSNGLTRQYMNPGDYFTAYVASGNANGLTADLYFNYRLLKGGSPFRT